ncbi:MAG: hypothetical protein AB1Z98_31375 [Nannocystaceae bacterium]
MSTPAHRRRWIIDACLSCALLVPACKTSSEPDTTTPVTGGDPVSAPVVELSPVEDAAQMLPRGTSIVVMGHSVAKAAEVFERERLIGEFRPQYEGLRSLLVGSMGHDLLDPATWQEVGLDANGPLGIAVVDVISGQLVVLATIADRAKLVTWVRDTAGRVGVELIEDAYGAASVLRAKDGSGPAVVMRDDVVALVLEGGEGPEVLARSMVTMEPNLSLAGQVGYRKATGGLREADMTVFVDLERMVEQINVQADARISGPSNNWAQEELERAQKEGAPAERLAELEQQALEEARMQEQWRAVEVAERALIELVVSGIDGVGVTMTSKRNGPIVDGRIAAGEEAFVRRLLDNRSGAPVLPVAMNDAPLWCGSGTLGRDATFELLEASAAADAKTWPELVAAAKAEIGLDLEADLRPAMKGEVELCITVEGKLDPVAKEPAQQIGLGAYLQVQDEAQAKYLLAKIATSSSTLAKRMTKRGSGYQVAVPDWRTMYVDPVGDRIVISSDKGLAKRIGSGDPGSMPSKIVPTAARGAMGLTGTAGAQAFDLSLMTLMFATGTMDYGEIEIAAAGLTPEQMAEVPLSRRSKKAKKALDAVNEELEAIERKRAGADLEQILAVTDPMGIGVIAATEDDRGFTLTGGQFVRAQGLGAVLEALLRGVTDRSGPNLSPEDRKALEDAWTRQSEAREELFEARTEDAERFQAKRKR